MHFFRVIPFGAPNRPHAADIAPTYMGDSIGWWDGDTLVIDTVGLNAWVLDAYHPDDGGIAVAQRSGARRRTHQVHRSTERLVRRDD